MEFDPNNRIVKYCLEAMELDEKGEMAKASDLFTRAWNEAADEHEKFIAAYYLDKRQADVIEQGPFYHGTRANLQIGDLLTAGFGSNYQADLTMNHIYFTALVNGAGLAAALAKGDGKERVYMVEPTGDFENDPNVTNKKFPGNPTRSYRTVHPLKIIGEATDWVKITAEELQRWRERLANMNGKIIN
jgi:hypothetical protein